MFLDLLLLLLFHSAVDALRSAFFLLAVVQIDFLFLVFCRI